MCIKRSSYGFPESSDNVIVINNCILYAKQYIYLEKLNDKKKFDKFNIICENL